jgi:acyl-CoA thioester hydrolase
VTVPVRLERAFRIRFDECGPDGTARAATFLRYAQDMAWSHSEAAGFDRDWYRGQGIGWLARCVELEVRGVARMSEAVTVSTEVVGWRRVWARRESEVRAAADATLLATVRTDWVMLGASGAPARVPPLILAAFPVTLPSFEPVRVPLAITPPEATRSVLRVRRHELDPLGHVNNAVYLDWLEEAVAGAGAEGALERPRIARLEYVRPAQPASEVAVAVWNAPDGGWACRMSDADGAELLRAELLPRP